MCLPEFLKSGPITSDRFVKKLLIAQPVFRFGLLGNLVDTSLATTVNSVRLNNPDSRHHGFSLLEMIVATTLLSLAIVGLLGVIQTSLSNAVRVQEYDRVAMLARSTMSEIWVQDPLPVPGEMSGSYDDRSGWEAIVKPFEMPFVFRASGVMVARIELSVWWLDEGRKKTQVFNGFKRVRITPDHIQEISP